MKKVFIILIAVLAVFAVNSCRASVNGDNAPVTNVIHPEWTEDAVIYEVNVRQFTPEGTFKAFSEHLPRLADLGVDILWFMPIHPIGEVERKGSLGSYYSVRDYKAVSPEFGDAEDFRKVVDDAHRLGMKVIIDWVANHSSRDHEWIETHPDWYVMDSTGSPVAPFDWTDVAKLDYANAEMREAMKDALKFWVTEFGIDGYRCDVAHEVPVDFWNEAMKELRTIREDLFFLAEAEKPELMTEAFDAYYGWENHAYMNKLAQGKAGVEEYVTYLKEHADRFPSASIQMNFTSNHDENSWSGTEFDRMGDAVRQFAALTFVLPGMPLIYNGQEMGSRKSLEFFERDPIVWEDTDNFTDFYKGLIKMRDEHPSMYAPRAGAPMQVLSNSEPEKVLSFQRMYDDGVSEDGFTAIFNFSSEEITVTLAEGILKGSSYTLPAHGYEIIFDMNK